jgi:hypothetical protein
MVTSTTNSNTTSYSDLLPKPPSKYEFSIRTKLLKAKYCTTCNKQQQQFDNVPQKPKRINLDSPRDMHSRYLAFVGEGDQCYKKGDYERAARAYSQVHNKSHLFIDYQRHY